MQTDIRALQAPFKERYKTNPAAAFYTLHAEGVLGHNLTCKITSRKPGNTAGQHPATGGSGEYLCSGDMLLESLVACAGVTLNAVATSMRVALDEARVRAEGDLDFRGTLGMGPDIPVGFTAIRLIFELRSNSPAEKLIRLIELAEKYCVIYQTLKSQIAMSVQLKNVS